MNHVEGTATRRIRVGPELVLGVLVIEVMGMVMETASREETAEMETGETLRIKLGMEIATKTTLKLETEVETSKDQDALTAVILGTIRGTAQN